MHPPVPEALYDAALRLVSRAALPDDAQRLRDWLEAYVRRLTERDVALEVLRRSYEGGVEGRSA